MMTRRSPMRRCGKPYDDAGEALRSKAGQEPGVTAQDCARCGKVHLVPLVPSVRTPLRPVRKAAARTGAASGLPRPAGEFTAAVKLAVRRRAGRGSAGDARCEACGIFLGRYGGQVHHRVGRGSGGCRDEVLQSPANAALLCGTPFSGCHGAATGFSPHLGMDAAGFWIGRGTTPEFDPRNVPVMLHGAGGGGLAVYLAEDGLGPDGTGYLLQAPGSVAA